MMTRYVHSKTVVTGTKCTVIWIWPYSGLIIWASSFAPSLSFMGLNPAMCPSFACNLYQLCAFASYDGKCINAALLSLVRFIETKQVSPIINLPPLSPPNPSYTRAAARYGRPRVEPFGPPCHRTPISLRPTPQVPCTGALMLSRRRIQSHPQENEIVQY